MPYANIRHDGTIPEDVLRTIARELPGSIAGALSCIDEGGQLASHDVEVAVAEFGPMDTTPYRLEVIVEANYFPSREGNLIERTKRIADLVKALLPAGLQNGFVWVRLFPAAFVEF